MRLLHKIRAIVILTLGFLWDLVAASAQVATIVLAPRIRTYPAILIVPVHVRRRWAVALYAWFTSLTPGSTCLHVSDDRRRFYVHVLDARDPARTIARFERVYERWIRALEA